MFMAARSAWHIGDVPDIRIGKTERDRIIGWKAHRHHNWSAGWIGGVALRRPALGFCGESARMPKYALGNISHIVK